LVLIENQLERTDHTHMGQLLTYAAGLKAVTIVWIADNFTDEHRAALDWLNDITDERFNFFGLEVELWRIANSPIAPKFNIICKPNDWTRSIGGAARRLDEGELSETKQLQLEYWTELRKLLLDRNGVIKPQKPLPQHWSNYAIGRSDFSMSALVNTQKKNIWVSLTFHGENAKLHFYLIQDDKEAIEKELGTPLDWLDNPGKKQSRIVLMKYDTDPTNRSDWTNQHQWIADNLETFHRVFSSRVKNLESQ